MAIVQSTAMEYRRRVCLAMDYINNNLAMDLTLEEIAGAASFSMFHFHRIFKAVVGETVSEYTRRLRLEHAANRLLSSRQPVTQIAMDCGFSTSQNFAKAFGQCYGMTPSTYRNSKRGNMGSKLENAQSLHTLYDRDNSLIIQTVPDWKSGMRVIIKELPQYHVAYVRKMGPDHKETAQAFGELMQWAGPRGYLQPEMMLAILYWDNPEVTSSDKCRVDACVSVPVGIRTEGPIGLQYIRGGPYAVCQFEVKTELFLQAWQDAFIWLVNSGYESDDQPCYERYHNNPVDHPEGKWILDICIPLKGN